MKCRNSAFNAPGLRVIIVPVHVGALKIYVAVVEALRKKQRQDETQFTIKNGGKKWFRSQLFPFVKFPFRVMGLMPYYTETGRSCPPNRETLQISLFCCKFFPKF
jgi:hypothetical protein